MITSALYGIDNKLKIVTVTNTDYESVTDTLILPAGKCELSEISDKFSVSFEEGRTVVKFTLTALESFAVYYVD